MRSTSDHGGRRLAAVAVGCALALAACSDNTARIPSQRVVVGTLTVDEKTGCSWITERNGVVETVWTDGTTADRSSRPPGLEQGGRLVARSGQDVQAEVVSDVVPTPLEGCQAPPGAELLAVTTVKVRSS